MFGHDLRGELLELCGRLLARHQKQAIGGLPTEELATTRQVELLQHAFRQYYAAVRRHLECEDGSDGYIGLRLLTDPTGAEQYVVSMLVADAEEVGDHRGGHSSLVERADLGSLGVVFGGEPLHLVVRHDSTPSVLMGRALHSFTQRSTYG